MYRLVLSALLVTTGSASAASGLFGATGTQLTTRFGTPRQQFFDLQRVHIADLFCVKGSYHPFVYDNESGLMVLHPEEEPLGGNTYGLCGQTEGESVYVRYEKNAAVAFAFGAPHGNTYDQGWTDALEQTLAGVAPGSKVIRTETVKGSSEGPYRTVSNGVRVLTFFSGDSPALVGWLLYGPARTLQAQTEPLLNLIRVQALRQQN